MKDLEKVSFLFEVNQVLLHIFKFQIRFQTADQDRDGLVDLAEYCLFRNPSKSQDFLRKVLRNAMLAEDTDMDGKISRKEFKGFQQKTINPKILNSRSQKFDQL